RDQLGHGLVAGHHAVVGGAGVVLYLLDRDQVGRLQVIDHDVRQGAEFGGRIGRRQVLHVEGGDGELARGGRRRGLLGEAAARDARRRGHIELVVAAAVGQHTDGRAGQRVADVDRRGGRERVVDEHALRVHVGLLADDAAACAAGGAAGRYDDELAAGGG